MTDEKKQNLQLEYPCPWVYKVIGPDKDEMQIAVAEIIQDCKYKIVPSHTSETAKYICLNVELTVESKSQRIAFYEALKAHRAIKMVL